LLSSSWLASSSGRVGSMKLQESKSLKKLFFVIIIVSLVFQSAETSSESRYTREKSEKLFHRIQWHEYTPETFITALKKQKPIFLVISAPAWCYWCHVYESEDYLYHPEVYSFINEHFVAIFVDSDKRPDLTKKYLEGGWPSTTIFSPDFRRISGFTGPQDPHALKEFLAQIINYFKDKIFTDFSDEFRYEKVQPIVPAIHQLVDIENMFLSYVNSVFDKKYGGFIQGNVADSQMEQKFPTGFVYIYLLEKYRESGKKDYLTMIKTTFDNQYTDIERLEEDYRLYDPVEGGFHRYSTKTDWRKPHYEKMLGDQAKLIRAYANLSTITGDDTVRAVVDKTLSFIKTKFYDATGGFYASQDAYLEHAYYGLPKQKREEIPPPYIDKTRIMDANSMMISTLLSVSDIYKNKAYAKIAMKSLDFIQDEMISHHGAYYFYDYEKARPFLTGQSIANSWALLAFLDGYAVSKEKKYLATAVQIARYSLNNLYDWNSGGFFERNSRDAELYGPYEKIDLSKPYRENAVFSHAMLRLYQITGDLAFLESGLKTLGYLMIKSGSLDEMYYVLKTAELVRENNLLDIYSRNEDKIDILLTEGKEAFFLNKIFDRKKDDIVLDDAPKFRDDLTSASTVILVFLAFFAGLLSFLSPCTLPVLSAYFAQGISAKKGEILKHTMFFFFGLATVFSVFGMGATLAGNVLRQYRLIFTHTAAIVIVIFGILELFGKGFSGLNLSLKRSHKTPIGSYLFGSVFAIGWSACIGPILASLLLLSATTGTVFKGTVLLFIYSLGLAVPLVLVSLFFDRIKNKTFWKILRGKGFTIPLFKKQLHMHSTYLISGVILIVLGILIYNDYLYKLNQLTYQTDYVQNLIVKGEEFLRDILLR
jgi:cytochrome c-type biogenesis protein